jgi:hypothetical protein
MKIGAEDKKKVIAMGVLLVIAIPLVIYNFGSFGSVSGSSPSPSPAPATEVSQQQPDSGANQVNQKKGPKVRERTLDPTLRTDILAASQKVEYTGGSRNIFHVQEAPVNIPALAANPRPTPPPAPTITEPPKPQIPLRYYGFSDRPGEAKKAFLQDGENIFVAVEGDVVERRYKIVKITNRSILVEDVLNNNQQNIDLTPPTTG